MAEQLPQKVRDQMKKAGLPDSGSEPFKPKLATNRKGDEVIEKRKILHGPKAGKEGYVDTKGDVWIKDRAHGGIPDHWDVQEDDGKRYHRIGLDGEPIP